MHVPINIKSPNNISEWQMGFNSAFKGLNIVQVLFSLSSVNEFEKPLSVISVVYERTNRYSL